jgi:fucose permease
LAYTHKHTLYACYLGYITQAIVVNLAPLLFVIFQNTFGISFEMIGRLILINFGTQIVIDILAARYVDRIGYRPAAVAAHIFSAAGLIGLSVLPRVMATPYTGLTIAVVIYAIGGGLIEVLISPIVNSLPGDAKASAMSLLHAFYCWGQMGVVLGTTLLIKLLGADIWYALPILWALVPIYNVFRFLKVPLMPTLPPGQQMHVRRLVSSDAFIIALILMMCAGASELTMSQWSSLFAEKGLHVSKLVGDLLGPCLFAVLMGIGRTMYGVWGHKIHLERTLMASGALCVLCYAVTVFSPNPVVALLSCAVCGFSVSLMWPGMLSLTSAAFPKGGTLMFGLLAVFGDVGAAIGPWLAGVLSDVVQKSSRLAAYGAANNLNMEQLGLKAGLLLGMVFPLALFAGVVMLRRIQNDNRLVQLVAPAE